MVGAMGQPTLLQTVGELSRWEVVCMIGTTSLEVTGEHGRLGGGRNGGNDLVGGHWWAREVGW